MAITDDFTDTNGVELPAHGNWEQTYNNGGGAVMEIQSNACVHTAASNSSIYRRTDGAFPDNQYGEFEFSSLANGTYFGVGTRCSDDGDGYIFTADPDEIYLSRFDNGAPTVIGNGSPTTSANDVFRLTSVGSVHTPSINGGGEADPPGEQTDATYASGNPGMRAYGNGSTVIDNFECSDLAGGAVTQIRTLQDAAAGFGPQRSQQLNGVIQ